MSDGILVTEWGKGAAEEQRKKLWTRGKEPGPSRLYQNKATSTEATPPGNLAVHSFLGCVLYWQGNTWVMEAVFQF